MIAPDFSKFVFGGYVFDKDREFVAIVPAGLHNRNQLFDALRRELRLPEYFGDNWDALDECLRDLCWIKHRQVVIVHHDVPRLAARDLATYLDILLASAKDWPPDANHELLVAFPTSARNAVLNALTKTTD